MSCMADFVRDPRMFSAASFYYARFWRFGSPSANCVIPLAALASLPPSINSVTAFHFFAFFAFFAA